jgi:DNA polymerase lambda
VRDALVQGTLALYENARIGVLFYEDFQEKMSRDEVKQISDIVAVACRKHFKDAEINTMGSYRRGSETCGDVDVLITHPKFINCIPKGAVDELVERLRDDGKISHHLTPVDPNHKTTLPLRLENLDDTLLMTSKKAESYMGVFISPMFPKKHRRIDIKFYPYRERASASLYFTGNGWFNRAMRLHAKVKKGMKLDDSGLYVRTIDKEKKMSREGKRIKARSEKEIFDLLGLVYKEPSERDSLEAIVPNEVGLCNILDLDKSTNDDFATESRYTWIE